MAREKRTKPCSNCKKSKVKCIYTEALPCERCVKIGQAANCQFVPKLPSLKLPLITPSQHIIPSQKPSKDVPLPSLQQITRASSSPEGHSLNPYQNGSDLQWKLLMESRINSFDSKLNDIFGLLKSQNAQVNGSRNTPNYEHDMSGLYQPLNYGSFPLPNQHRIETSNTRRLIESPGISDFPSYAGNTNGNSVGDTSEANNDVINKKRKAVFDNRDVKRISTSSLKDSSNVEYPDDFRNGFLTLGQARELFRFFDLNISPQLFGFEISKLSLEYIWTRSPILICAIGAISSIHHPDKTLSEKSKQLQKYLAKLCGEIVFTGRPKGQLEGFNTVVALVLCSFWLSNSQMFTGLALQIAKEIGLDKPPQKEETGPLNSRDRIKLWYLLYILDGNQSLTFNRSPLFDSKEHTLRHGREILLEDKSESLDLMAEKELNKAKNPESVHNIIDTLATLTDIRLVSQVEYNQALSEVFAGNAWDLMAPASFGIPFRTNLELDKWMVSWTVLLAAGNNSCAWSSKSTLIYYNFAKMHINSQAVRKLGTDSMSQSSILPKWSDELKAQDEKRFIKPQNFEHDKHEDESDDEEEFISNDEVIPGDEKAVSTSLATNAAHTVINLVLSDTDIMNNLKYVPVHIHVMLYYAALLLVNPPSTSSNDGFIGCDNEEYYDNLLANLSLVKELQGNINMNLPTDRNFGEQLITSLDDLVDDKLFKIKSFLTGVDSPLSTQKKSSLLKQLHDISNSRFNKGSIELIDSTKDSVIKGSSPGPEKISAWPGFDHRHPWGN